MEEDIGEELKTFIKVWITAVSSICYCYLIPVRISHGVPRLLTLLPVITVFSILPLQISTVHLALPAFFFLVWLGNFKLLLFAFNRGPLSSTPQLPILSFISVALFPINIRKQIMSNKKNSSDPAPILSKPVVFTVKALILYLIVVTVNQYKDNLLHWNVITSLYFCYMYLSFEFGFAITAFAVKVFHGFDLEIEPQFNEPYLATSLQDFWGRRWNLMSSSILRAAVYNPMREIWTPALGTLRAQMLAIFVTFVVSGLMHELMYFYLMRVPPTWEVWWYFVLHGACTAVEVAVKKADRFGLHRVVSGLLTMGFVSVTGPWLLLAQIIRNGVDEKIIKESSVLLKILKFNK